jgi:hypothetical protein
MAHNLYIYGARHKYSALLLTRKKFAAIKTNFFADDHHGKKIDSRSEPLLENESHIDSGILAAEIDGIPPRL